MKTRIIYLMMLLAAMAGRAVAQAPNTAPAGKQPSKAWEFGLGGSVYQFSRASFSNFSPTEAGYVFGLKLDHAVYGGNLYVARELSDHFYADFQGTVGVTTNRQTDRWRKELLYAAGLGLQWRFGEYFESTHIDPYLRAGVGYMRKNFDILYAGTEGLDDEQMKWTLDNLMNKEGMDRKDLLPISLGVGLNMWLNDRWGIGMQGDYLVMPHRNVANSIQGTVRVMYRLGGRSKKTQPAVQYVDRIVEVEKIVERVVERVVETQTPAPMIRETEKLLIPEDVYFDFGKADLKPESNEILDRLAEIMQHDTSMKYLITGYTDSRGGDEYNRLLSRQRAEAVVKALVDRGVPTGMLKARGVGSRIAYAGPSEPNEVRYGDRKITIEPISNRAYWDHLPEHGF
jgi:outer membrane protein OmpA-like peptidoglycan-associated protein